ncbi:MAG: hypothetical protein ACUZ8E_17700 [Candidatus Anammoxibacter sp.]
MSSKDVKLRGASKRRHEDYPLGEIPDNVIIEIARQFVHRIAIGHADITGDDFGTIFANAIDGLHRGSPLGIADVPKENCAWSVKTVKSTKPFETQRVRLISGRNSPDYSMGISDPRVDPTATGRAVLSIWNARVNEALEEFDDLRILVCVRNFSIRQFLIFEEEATRFSHADYRWEFNKRGNLEGHDIAHGEHIFTWQPHGSQFTIIRKVPAHARKFSINQSIPIIQMEHILNLTRFNKSWVTIEDG